LLAALIWLSMGFVAWVVLAEWSHPTTNLAFYAYMLTVSIAAALLLTTGIWFSYLLVRYALAFRRARREALLVFAGSDLAAGSAHPGDH
jgi:predicted Na+-dependent transporter